MNIVMKPKIKIYFDTSVISALFDDRNPDRKHLTEIFFANITEFDPYISSITNAEIDHSPDEDLKDKMKACVKRFIILETCNDIDFLAQQYIENGAIPRGYQADAYHVAFAVFYEIDYLLSWNFKHVVRQKTCVIVKFVNTKNNYRNVDIMTQRNSCDDGHG